MTSPPDQAPQECDTNDEGTVHTTDEVGPRMLEHRIVGATIVDGTGAPAFEGDLGVRDGRIVTIVPAGTLTDAARHTIDATGLVVCPGFVDLHTHYDAQLFWDPFATPS